MSDIIKTQAVASDLTVKEVTGLDKVERVLDDDVLLLIRPVSDGSQKCYSAKGRLFHGEDAYEIAVKNGFSGTYEDWQDAVKKVVDVQPAVNNLAKATEDAEKATADAITATDAINLIIEQVTEAEATRQSNEKARISKETERQEAETARYEAEQVRIAAELERADEFRTAKEAVEKATEGANEVVNHPPYVDQDGYYYKWDAGTKNYDKTDVNLTGKAFSIKKVFASVLDMEATDIDAFDENDFVLINTANVDDDDNAKLYVVAVNENGDKFYSYLVDLSGFRGFTGKTPQIIVGNVETLDSQSDVSVSMSADGVDSDGNPRYKLNFGIPRGDHFTFADLTEAEKNELMQPAVEAAEAANSQTLLCQTATNEANDASEKSKEQTTLCQTATNEANEVLKKISDMGSAINVTVEGDGNAVTSVTQDGANIKFKKGKFLSFNGEWNTQEDKFWEERGIYQLDGITPDNLSAYTYGTLLCLNGVSSRLQLYSVMDDYKNANLYLRTGWASNKSGWRRFILDNDNAYLNCLVTGVNRYYSPDHNYGLNLQNSDIIGCNAIFFNDRSDDSSEALLFPRSNGNYDAIWAQDGNIKFTVNKPLNGNGTDYTVATTENLKGYLPLSGGTMAANSRIAFNSDYLYIGNSSNKGWIRLQDICSANEAGDGLWSIRTNGNAIFNSVTSKNDVVAYTSSDARLKTNIHKDDYLKCIESLGGIYAFTYKKNNKDSIGLIAQNLLNTTFADIVSKDDDGYYKVNYWSPKLISLALGGVEQLSDEVKELRSQVAELKAMIKTLKKNKL